MIREMAENRRVLVVEDDADIAELVALHVRDLGCTVDIENRERVSGPAHPLAPSVCHDDVSPVRRRGDAPWPGGLPVPAPAVVPDQPVPVELLDEHDRPVRVSGRGEVSSPPVTITVGSGRRRLRSWAGPWPVDQRWWADDRSRRVARFQIVTEDGVAHLVGVEQQRWSILATYS